MTQETFLEMTRTEALTLALKSAILAPTQSETDLAVATATHLAAAMSDSDVADAKKSAQEAVKYARQQGAEG
jgi:hypothetical protein